MTDPSYRQSVSFPPLKPLPPPDVNDTYEWTKVLAVSTGAKLLKTTSGQPLLAIVQDLNFADDDDNPQVGTFKVETSSRWFPISSTEVNGKHVMTNGDHGFWKDSER